jgi:hypothetical protein
MGARNGAVSELDARRGEADSLTRVARPSPTTRRTAAKAAVHQGMAGPVLRNAGSKATGSAGGRNARIALRNPVGYATCSGGRHGVAATARAQPSGQGA